MEQKSGRELWRRPAVWPVPRQLRSKKKHSSDSWFSFSLKRHCQDRPTGCNQKIGSPITPPPIFRLPCSCDDGEFSSGNRIRTAGGVVAQSQSCPQKSNDSKRGQHRPPKPRYWHIAFDADFQPPVWRDSSFANNLRGPLVIAHSDKGAMPQVSGVSPLDKSDLANQLRLDPAALVHFFCG